MTIKPFSDSTTADLIANQKQQIQNEIDELTNAEIMANDTAILAENFYQKYYIEPVIIHEEDFSKRRIEQGSVKKHIEPFFRDYPGMEYENVDGVTFEFHYPFDGEEELFTKTSHTQNGTCTLKIQ